MENNYKYHSLFGIKVKERIHDGFIRLNEVMDLEDMTRKGNGKEKGKLRLNRTSWFKGKHAIALMDMVENNIKITPYEPCKEELSETEHWVHPIIFVSYVSALRADYEHELSVKMFSNELFEDNNSIYYGNFREVRD